VTQAPSRRRPRTAQQTPPPPWQLAGGPYHLVANTFDAASSPGPVLIPHGVGAEGGADGREFRYTGDTRLRR
jgi:hypothetical protein